MAAAIIRASDATMAKEPGELAERLATLIEESGLERAEISRRAGREHDLGWAARLILSARDPKRKGKMPTIPTCWDLARGLGVSLAQLLGPELLAGPPVTPIPEPPPRGPTTIEREAAELPPRLVASPTPILTPASKRGER